MRSTLASQICLSLCGSLLLFACGTSLADRPARMADATPAAPAAPAEDPSSEAPSPERPGASTTDAAAEADTPGLGSAGPNEARPRAKASAQEPPQGARKPRERREATQQFFSPRHPFDDLSDAELEKLVTGERRVLGSLSVGLPNNGRLLNGVQPKDGELFELVSPGLAYGTQETIEYLETAVRKVHARFPGTPPLHVGHVSARAGGYLSPHLSHQSGRDVDLGFYYSGTRRWYARATTANFDVERNWALVRALITETDVEMILVDHSLQRLLKAHALDVGEDPEWVEGLFRTRQGRPALIRHVKGHQTHFHVRFFNPLAQRGAQRAYPLLVKHGLIPPVVSYVNHVAKKGDSLLKLARVYRTTVRAIQRANGLRSTVIIAKRTYKIPRTGGPTPVTGKLTFPTRRLPPYDPPERNLQKQTSKERSSADHAPQNHAPQNHAPQEHASPQQSGLEHEPAARGT